MKPFERSARSHVMWLMLSMLGALALAQPSQAAQQGVRGPMWACRTSQFGSIVSKNAQQGLRVKNHHFNPFLGVFLFSTQERNGAPSNKCHVSPQMAPLILQINNNVQVGVAVLGDVTLVNQQTNVYVSPQTWYFACPASQAGTIIQKNNSVQKAFTLGGSVILQSDQTNVAAPASVGQNVVQINNNVQIAVAVGGDVTLVNSQTNAVI